MDPNPYSFFNRMLFVAFKIGHMKEFVELIGPTRYKKALQSKNLQKSSLLDVVSFPI